MPVKALNLIHVKSMCSLWADRLQPPVVSEPLREDTVAGFAAKGRRPPPAAVYTESYFRTGAATLTFAPRRTLRRRMDALER